MTETNPFGGFSIAMVEDATPATGGPSTFTSAADRVEAGIDGAEAKLLAKRVRGTVARTVDEVLWRAAHALGPAPLAQDEAHAKRVADLALYVRQHHAERDDESLGRLIRRGGSAPW